MFALITFSLAFLIAPASGLMAAPTHFDVRVQSQPIELLSLQRKNLYAAGLSENGEDVIVIANGNVSVARVSATGAMTVSSSLKVKTSDLISTTTTRWIEVPLTIDFADRESLHAFLDSTLKKFGFENPGTVPFLLKGRFKKTDFMTPKPSGTAELSRSNVEGLVVGFFTKKVESSDRTELRSVAHAVFEKPKAVGRISTLAIEANRVILYLPK